jgi:predicted O-methyltransferase YrrM
MPSSPGPLHILVKIPNITKVVTAIGRIVARPRESAAWVWRGSLAKDRTFVTQMSWVTGTLPRIPLVEILPATRRAEVSIPNAFDRTFLTSISLEEAGHLGAIARSLPAKNVLEIGTYDGNSALVLATNSHPDGFVVTVDLPPDWDPRKGQSALAFSTARINLTDRGQLGRQIREYPVAARVKQVFGDSGTLDWSTFGGPFDLIFLDGCHSEKYVESDTRNALKVLAPGGIIVWHDYGMVLNVSVVVDRFARELGNMKFAALEGTRLAIAIRNAGSSWK